MISISNNFSTLKSVDNQNKCWIHTVDFKIPLIKSIDNNPLIGFKKNINSKNLSQKFFPGNEIFLVTRIENNFVCYGYTIVEEIEKNNDILYDFYDNKIKLKLKRIKYFLQPVVLNNIQNKLDSIKSTRRISDVLKVGYYKEISSDDYNLIKKQSSTTGMFPVYLEEYSKNMKEFILNTCKSLYNVLKIQHNKSQIEITEFILLLKESLRGFGVNKDFEDLKRFYSRYAYELNFRHVPTRDPQKFVVLLNQSGEKKNFGYIDLK